MQDSKNNGRLRIELKDHQKHDKSGFVSKFVEKYDMNKFSDLNNY
jgi:hypothetical protein